MSKKIFLAMGYQVLFENENVLNLAASWQLVGGVDIIWAHRKYTLDMLERAIPGTDGVPVIGPEGIIGLKVQAIANDPDRMARDMADIEWLLKAHFKTMDIALIREYFDVFAMLPQWDELLQRTGHA